MTDLRQAAQQALEALEGLFGLPNQWESGGVAVWRLGGSDAPRQAITALRTALEQQAEPPPEWPLIKNILAVFGLDAIAFVAAWQAAKRPWVGLTDEDFLEACQLAERGNYLVAFQRIQIKLKERNA